MNKYLKSWCIAFNSFFLAALPVFEYAKEALPEIQPYVSDSTYKLVGIIVVVGNILFRMKTIKSLDK